MILRRQTQSFLCILLFLFYSTLALAQLRTGASFRNTRTGVVYTIDRFLGDGGFGDVYLAHAQAPSGELERVALKFLKRGRGAFSPGYDAARTIAGSGGPLLITHEPENIVALGDVGPQTIDVTTVIRMEAAAGSLGSQNLRLDEEADADDFELRLQLAERFVEHISAALAVMADAGLTHNDIKPDNIFIRKVSTARGGADSWQFVLGDFDAVTSVGVRSRFVTSFYQPPEAQQDPTHRSAFEDDLFAAALSAFEVFFDVGPEDTWDTDAPRRIAAALQMVAMQRSADQLARFDYVCGFVRIALERTATGRRRTFMERFPTNVLSRAYERVERGQTGVFRDLTIFSTCRVLLSVWQRMGS